MDQRRPALPLGRRAAHGHPHHVGDDQRQPQPYCAPIVAFDDEARAFLDATGRRVHALSTPLTGHTHDVYVVAFNPDGRTLTTGSNDQTGGL